MNKDLVELGLSAGLYVHEDEVIEYENSLHQFIEEIAPITDMEANDVMDESTFPLREDISDKLLEKGEFVSVARVLK